MKALVRSCWVVILARKQHDQNCVVLYDANDTRQPITSRLRKFIVNLCGGDSDATAERTAKGTTRESELQNTDGRASSIKTGQFTLKNADHS